MAAKQAGQVDWYEWFFFNSATFIEVVYRWQPLEACLAAINNEEVADILETARDFGKPAPIDLEALLANLLPPILTEHGKLTLTDFSQLLTTIQEHRSYKEGHS